VEEESKHHYRVGLFVVTSIAGLAVLLFVLGGRKLFQPTYIFETYFDGSVAGLEVGAPLRFRGVALGQVSEILVSGAVYEREVPLARRHNYIVVRAKIDLSAAEVAHYRNDRPEMIRMGLRAQTQVAGISGQQFLAVDFLEPGKYPPLQFDWVPRYDYVPSAPNATAQILANAQSFMARLGELDVKKLSGNLDALLAKLNEAVGRLQVAELSADAQKALKAADQTLARFNHQLANPALEHGIDNITAITASLREMTERGDLDRTINRLDEAVARLNGLVADNQYDTRAIVQDLRVTARNLRELSATLKQRPGGALIGGPPEKVRLPEETSR
jgi:phospholipid/cholesterol/gamma-HCH transport system substrate-binding protein/paraquat-inducible protein B